MQLPEVGDAVPRRGNVFSKAVGTTILRLSGWRIEGTFPNVPKFIAIAAPHTANWDFISGIATVLALQLRANWIGKNTIFRWPFGGFFRWLGGIPLDRSKPQGLVAQTIEMYQSRDQLLLGIAPEGTRKVVDRWKMGFYHIASGGDVPIFPVYWDYDRKVFGLGPLVYPTGNLEADLERIYAVYIDLLGEHPLAIKNPDYQP